MPTTDTRQMHIYRKPVHQKRAICTDHHMLALHTGSPSPKRSRLVSRRRHSTPPASTLRVSDCKSSSSNRVAKYYYPNNTRHTRINGESISISDSFRSIPSSNPLAKRRFQDERTGYISTTPSSIASITDIVLPIAKKNRSTIVDIPSHIKFSIQPMNRESSTTIQRDSSKSLTPGSHVFISDGETSECSLSDYIHKPKPIQASKWYHRKCPCRLSCCTFCCKWYYRCPLFCWSLCFFLVIALIIGIFISFGYLSS
ncbi:unnamed protein product [Rotaria magnacalcarata]|uniref:Uncharacterized protein n=3 Tax=Rotaria magnacalcarata TaxID=392030 RepID=A0A819BYD6_9BILA|nr:unnamed protein product [Rotaria magnacalcarata]CAF3884440.1 unnamed protein product [Rotaria magnacalcarata]CAF3956250.1 unnamed protein product [Rotaria magnacalcarata]CAF5144467.1 unnamed protein product [Rotaria magnacalcarata]